MFDDRFEVFLADTEQAKEIHHNLRYKIYCLDKRFEDPAAFRNFQESDCYDETAVHFIVRSRESGQWLGAMRLLVGSLDSLPIMKLATIQPQLFRVSEGLSVAEASRLCVIPTHRNGRGSNGKRGPRDGGGVRTSESECVDMLHASWISLGLIRAARQYCLDLQIRYGFFFIADALARILKRVGMDIRTIGPACEHKGLRRPYIHDIKEGYAAMSVRSPLVDRMFQRVPAYKSFSEVNDVQDVARLVANG